MARPVWPLVTFWKCWSWSTLWTHRTGFRFLIHFLYHQGGDSAYLYLLEDVFNFPFFWHVFAFYFFFFIHHQKPTVSLTSFTSESRLAVVFRQCHTSCFAYFPLGTMYITFILWDLIFTFSCCDLFF